MIYIISIEFLSLSRRRSSLWNVPQQWWARRNVCRSQAILIWMSLVKEVSRYWLVHVMFKMILLKCHPSFGWRQRNSLKKKPDFYWSLSKSCENSNGRNHIISLYWCFFQIFNQSVIILVINAGVQFVLQWVCAYSLIWTTQCFVTNVNHNYDKSCDNLSCFKINTHNLPRVFLN